WRPCVPRPRCQRACRHLCRDRPPRAGRPARRSAAADGRTLSMAAGGRAAGGAAGDGALAGCPAAWPGARPQEPRRERHVTDALAHLQFLRPAWLWALLALPLLAVGWWWRRRQASVWHRHVDAH